MGNRLMSGEPKTFGRKPRRFQAGFVVAAAANPAIAYPQTLAAAGFARAEHTATGKYEFELADVWPTVLNGGVSVPAVFALGATYGSAAENENLYAQAGASVSGSTGRIIITVRLKAGAVNTDPAGGGINVWIEVESAPDRGQ